MDGSGGIFPSFGVYEDIFKNSIPVAEEAICVEENAKDERETNRHLSEVKNTMEIQLNDTNVVVFIEKDDVTANGYVTKYVFDIKIKTHIFDI